MLQIFFAYIISILVLMAFDLSWLGFIMRNFYQSRLASILAPTPNWYAAGAFYLLFVAGLFYFAAYPAHLKQSILSAIIMGAIYGLVTYGTYDLTNMATVQNWPLVLTVVDMLWGTFLGAVLACVAYGLLHIL